MSFNHNDDAVLTELNALNATNHQMAGMFKKENKSKVLITAIGNSISNGMSMSEPGKMLLDRNEKLIDIGKSHGVDFNTYQLSRWEANNSVTVADWIARNCCEKDAHEWSINDYKRFPVDRNYKLYESDEEIDELFKGGSTEGIQERLRRSGDDLANIVIINVGTGSFLDVLTRHGSLTIPNIFYSLHRDVAGLTEILSMIERLNRDPNVQTKTQVYLCGAPRVMNTIITDAMMNPSIKKVAKEFANVTYVPTIPRQPFYIDTAGRINPDIHYNEEEYYRLLNSIERHIIDTFPARDLMIDLDRALYKMNTESDLHGAPQSLNDALDVVDDIAKKYESKAGNYNYFIDLAKEYVHDRYPYDFYRISQARNIAKDISKLKKK